MRGIYFSYCNAVAASYVIDEVMSRSTRSWIDNTDRLKLELNSRIGRCK